MKILFSMILCIGFYGWYRSIRKKQQKKKNYDPIRYPLKSEEELK